MQKLTDLKGFQRSCFKLLWVDFFFLSKIVSFYFEVATFSSIALRAFACALRLSPHMASRPRGASGPAALLRDGWEGGSREAQEQGERTQRVAVGRQEAERARGPQRRRALPSARRRACLRSAAAEKHSTAVFTLFTARAPAAPLLFTAALLLLSWWGGGQGGFLCLYF